MYLPLALKQLSKELGFNNDEIKDYSDVVKLQEKFEFGVKNVEDTFHLTRCKPPVNFNGRVAQLRQLFKICLGEAIEAPDEEIVNQRTPS